MIVIGPKQTILSNASNATAATHIIGASDNALTTDKGLPVRDTLGAIGIVFRAYCATPSTGTLVLALPYVSWTGLVAAAAAIPVQALTGLVLLNPSAAVTMSGFTTAPMGAALAYLFGDSNAQGLNVCPYPNLHARITVGTATMAGLTIEAATIRQDGTRYDLNLQTPSGAAVLAQPFAW